MTNFTISLTGTAPLLMRNSRLANPADPAAKALKKAASKRTKTDDDLLELARLEFLGSLYLDPDVGPHLPGDNIWRALYDSAKKRKLGPKIKEGVIITTDVNPLAYPGPRDPDALWANPAYRLITSVKVSMSRIMRCRPMFADWRAEAEGVYDPALIDVADLTAIAESAGALVGIGDWRPRYGRFEAQVKAQ